MHLLAPDGGALHGPSGASEPLPSRRSDEYGAAIINAMDDLFAVEEARLPQFQLAVISG
jgi:hypothetical protein